MIGDLGKEQFQRAITRIRNRHIAGAVSPVFLLREEVLGSDDFADRGGLDTPAQHHFKQLLINCDKWRRRVTHNPDSLEMGSKIAKAINAELEIEVTENPFGGDDIQNATGYVYDLPFDLAGDDPNIPLHSQLQIKSTNARVLLGIIDQSIVFWTRCNSKDRTSFITHSDSMRIYGLYQTMLEYLNAFGGDENRVDVAQLLPSEEPLGPTDSPNRKPQAAS